jgi:putative membrane protein
VSSRIDSFFSEADRDAIREATREAERLTSGELVVYVAEKCDPHPEIGWKAALIGGALGALCAGAAIWRFGGWGAPDYFWLLIGLQLGVIAGWIASRFDAVARRLIGDEALSSRVDGRAAEAFIEERVYATAERTGILIFVALFEHRVVVLADEGISSRVATSAWESISTSLAHGLRNGGPAPALVEAVRRCAALLNEEGVTEPDPTNQLSNEPRFRHD